MSDADPSILAIAAACLRPLKWNELVRRGDFVEDGCAGFEPWVGPSGFRADAFVKPIYRRLKTQAGPCPEKPRDPVGSPHGPRPHIGTMTQAMGTPGTVPAGWQTVAPNEPRRRSALRFMESKAKGLQMKLPARNDSW
jgi:hypothetical protein